MPDLQPYRGSYLLPSFDHATVADVMRPGVVTCRPDASLLEVARAMANHRVHSVVVGGISQHGTGEPLWGVISDMALVGAAKDGLQGSSAGDIVNTEVVTVDISILLTEVARLMHELSSSHLVVTNHGRPCGVVSTLDIAGALAWGRS